MDDKNRAIDQDANSPQTRVAVVGTGLAGLTAAYLLRSDRRNRYDVTLFEQADRPSFDAASVTIENDTANVVERIDLPMRASAGGYYRHLLRMYRHLGIPLHPVRFLFDFAKAFPTKATDGTYQGKDGYAHDSYFVHASNLHQMPPPWPGNRGVVAHVIEILYLIVCQFWFTIACFLVSPLEAPACIGASESFAEYVQRIRLPRRFTSHYLLPLMSSVSTCTHDELLAFPASDVVNYKKLSHGQQHYTVCGGVSQVQARLTEGLDDMRLNSRVMEVIPDQDRNAVAVRWLSTVEGSSRLTEQAFDRVVLAVSPDVAVRIFKPLRSTLEKLPTRRVESSVLKPHGGTGVWTTSDSTDEVMGCMHHRVADASPSQVLTLRTLFDTSGARTEALHEMPSGVVISTCPLGENASGASLRTAKFTRTLRNTESRAVMRRMMGESRRCAKTDGDQPDGWMNGEDNVWVAGAWCWDGMVLLEGCVVSAMRVARDFDVRIPWE
ncbi:hypothetical protein ACJ41O_012854 [Fusarium nematophilum]